jgi:hypothetical protein
MATSSEGTDAEPMSGALVSTSASSAIHIEFPGRVLITAEYGADPELLRAALESLRK